MLAEQHVEHRDQLSCLRSQRAPVARRDPQIGEQCGSHLGDVARGPQRGRSPRKQLEPALREAVLLRQQARGSAEPAGGGRRRRC